MDLYTFPCRVINNLFNFTNTLFTMTRKEYQKQYQKYYADSGKKKEAQKRYYEKNKYDICDRLREKRAKLFENQ